MAFKAGDRVRQRNYGAGTITETDVTYTVIDFDAHGVRRFITRLVSLEPTDELAPPRRVAKTARRAPARPAPVTD
jgi:hypothetical protein